MTHNSVCHTLIIANYYVTSFRQREKDMRADDRGEPGRESRSFDYITTALTATFGWFTYDFFFSNFKDIS